MIVPRSAASSMPKSVCPGTQPSATARSQLRVPSRSFDQNRSAHLSRILNSYPGRDGVVLFVQQADGRRFRAELPVSVDAQSTVLKAEIRDLFGPEAMIA